MTLAGLDAGAVTRGTSRGRRRTASDGVCVRRATGRRAGHRRAAAHAGRSCGRGCGRRRFRYLARRLPGGHLRRPGQRGLGPARRRRGVRRRRVRGRHPRGHGRRRRRPRGAGRALHAAPLGGPGRGRAPRAGAGRRRDRPAVRARIAATRARRARHATRTHPDSTRAGRSTTAHYWLDGGYDDFVEFFFAQMFHEPHSTKQRRGRQWRGRTRSPRRPWSTARRAGWARRRRAHRPRRGARAVVAARSLVLHGSEDRVRSVDDGVRYAELHRRVDRRARRRRARPSMRDPVVVNHEIDRFVAGSRPERLPSPPPATPSRRPPSPRRRGTGRGPCAGSARCSCSARRSGSATPGATSRSPRSCAPSTPTSGPTGWPRTR